jgi:CheY-like chemotaxis protein
MTMEPRVLIIDDEQNLRINLAAYLEDEAMEVAAAVSGEEAVALVAGGARFDVCVVDMRLPGIDGNDTIRQLHAQDPGLLFTIHTGTATYNIPDDLRAMGISGSVVFYKPMPDMTPLTSAIRQLARDKKYPGS